MKQVKFDDLAVGTTFTHAGKQWVKTEKVKISCCKFNNAVGVDDPKSKAGIKPQEIVEVSE